MNSRTMNATRYPLVLAVLLTAIGAGWLLSTIDVVPHCECQLALAVGTLGITTLAFGRVNRQTFFTGFFLLVAAAIAWMHHTEHLPGELVLPGIMLAFGLSLALSHAIPPVDAAPGAQ